MSSTLGFSWAVVSFDPGKTGTEALTRATAGTGYPSSVKQVQ